MVLVYYCASGEWCVSGLERAVAVEVEQQRAVVDAVDQRGRVRVRVREGIVNELRAERLHGHLRELRRTQRERVRSPVEQLVQLRVAHLALLVALAATNTTNTNMLCCSQLHQHSLTLTLTLTCGTSFIYNY